MSLLGTLLGNPVVVWSLRIVGLALLAGVTSAGVATLYRLRLRERFPDGATLIVGLGVVAIWLNTRILLVELVIEDSEPFGLGAAVGNLAVFTAAAIASLAGRSMGDQLGTSERLRWRGVGPAWSPIVRATGRFITVTLPETIEDIEGYDPVSAETKDGLAGHRIDFPRGLTVDELKEHLIDHLTERFDVGYVDVDVEENGTVTYLALGQRAAGLGPSLPPGNAAVAIRADPPFSASPGDTVEIWEPGGSEPVGPGELRAHVDGTVATIACSQRVAEQIDPEQTYRLTTVAAGARPDREFATILRRHDSTMRGIDVAAGSPLVGRAVRDVTGTVLAIKRDGVVRTVPPQDDTVAAGDRLFVLARPDQLRTLEAVDAVASVPAETAIGETAVSVDTDVPPPGHPPGPSDDNK